MAVLIRPNSSFALDAIISLDAITYGGGNIWYDRSVSPGDNAILTDVTTANTSEGYQVLSFNGSTSVATVANNGLDFSTGHTIMMAIQPLESDGNRRNPYNQAYGGGGTWTHENNGTINWYFGNSGINGGSYIGFTSGFTVVQNEWAIVTGTRSTTNAYWYKNGVLTNSTTHNYPVVNTGTFDVLIGDGYTTNYLGNIGFCFVWDRELSSTEILTYYDRTKFRFGLS